MKVNMKVRASTIILILALSLGACAGLDAPEQEDAALRTAGRFLAVGLIAAKPEVLPAAKEYCKAFQVADQQEAVDLITFATGYLHEEFGEYPGVVDAALDIAILLGFDQIPAEEQLLNADTERLVSQVRMVLRGFCSGLYGYGYAREG